MQFWFNLCTFTCMKKIGTAIVSVFFLGTTLLAQPKGGSFPKIEKPSFQVSKPSINLNSPGKAVFNSGSSTPKSSSSSSNSGNINITRSARSQFGSGSNSGFGSSNNSSNSGGYTPRTYPQQTYPTRTYTPRTYYPSPVYYPTSPIYNYPYNPYSPVTGFYYRNNYYRTFSNTGNYYSRNSNSNTTTAYSDASTRLHAQKVELTQDLAVRSWILKSGVWDTLANVKPSVQEFYINNAENAFTIKSSGGIVFEFPANSFTDAFGNPIAGKVKLNVTELSKFSDFGTSGFSSSTTSGEMLESGGMVDVRAFNGKDNNNELLLAEGKQFTIQGNSPYKDGFQTFYGQRGEQVTWTTDPNQTKSNNSSDKSEGDKKYTLSIFPVLNYGEDGKAYPLILGEDLNGNEVSGMQFIDWFKENVKVPRELRKSIKKGGIHFPVTLYLNENGDIIDAVLADTKQASEGLIAPYFQEIRTTLLQVKGLVFANKVKVANTITVRLVTAEKEAFPATINPTARLPISAPINDMANSNEAGNWVLKSSSMQLVNCDRFVSVPKTSDTMHYEISRGDALIYYAFYDYNAMLKPNVNELTNTGYIYGLTNYAKNAKIRVIAIVYDDNGKVHLEVAENKDGKNKLGPKVVLPFNRYTAKAAFDLQPLEGFF